MGLIKKTFYTGVLSGVGLVSYLGATTTLTCPLPRDDPIWSSKSYLQFNRHRNPATQDVVTKTIPLSKIRPELLQREGDLAVELSRGVWSGLGYAFQRAYLARKYKGPATANQLWTKKQLSESTYEPGTQITDHFEVVDKTPTEITVRCGDSPRRPEPRNSDGLFVMSAKVDREQGVVELGVKSCFFNSLTRQEGIAGPMPPWMENLHAWYSRLLLATASWRLVR